MQRRRFSRDTKLKAAKSVFAGRSIRDVAAELKLHENVLRRWVNTYRADGDAAFSDGRADRPARGEVEGLKREIAKLRAERDALAKARRPSTAKTSITKSMLLDATEQIMVDEGYAAVSTRRVAKKIGVTASAVHYYFPTTNDLLLAAFRRKKELHDEGVEAALSSENPLHGLWKFYSDQGRTAIGIEFRAMVNHRKVIRSELAKDIEESRRRQISGIRTFLREAGLDAEADGALLAAMIIVGMGRALVTEEVLDVKHGHAEVRAAMDRLLTNADDFVTVLTILLGRQKRTKRISRKESAVPGRPEGALSPRRISSRLAAD